MNKYVVLTLASVSFCWNKAMAVPLICFCLSEVSTLRSVLSITKNNGLLLDDEEGANTPPLASCLSRTVVAVSFLMFNTLLYFMPILVVLLQMIAFLF